MQRLQFTLLTLILIALVAYGCDTLSLHFRIPDRQPLGSVQVQRYYAVKLKNKKTTYMFDEPAPEECVNALFPHQGDRPCWYVGRHRRQEVEIDSGKSQDFWKMP